MRMSDWSSAVCSSDLIDLASAAAHFFDGAPKIATVEQDDRCGYEVEGSRAGLLVLQATVAKATEPMEGDRSRQAVARLALVQLGGEIGRPHACTPVTNAHLVCRLLLETHNTTHTP